MVGFEATATGEDGFDSFILCLEFTFWPCSVCGGGGGGGVGVGIGWEVVGGRWEYLLECLSTCLSVSVSLSADACESVCIRV